MNNKRIFYLIETAQLWSTIAKEHKSGRIFRISKMKVIHRHPELRHIMDYPASCPACEYATNSDSITDCNKCAIEEWRETPCTTLNSPFMLWTQQRNNNDEAFEYAMEIANLALKNAARLIHQEEQSKTDWSKMPINSLVKGLDGKMYRFAGVPKFYELGKPVYVYPFGSDSRTAKPEDRILMEVSQ